MIVQLWNTNTSAFVSCDADLTENYMYISMKFGTGVHVFCWEVGVFNRSSFQSVSYKYLTVNILVFPLQYLSVVMVFTSFTCVYSVIHEPRHTKRAAIVFFIKMFIFVFF